VDRLDRELEVACAAAREAGAAIMRFYGNADVGFPAAIYRR
jgi:hypothetical protein